MMIIYTNAVEAHASSVWPVVFQHAGLFFSEGRTGTKLCLPPSLAVRELLNGDLRCIDEAWACLFV